MEAQSEHTITITDYLDSILEVLSDGIYISDSKGKTLKVNNMHEKLTGLKREELLGRLVTDLKREGIFDHILNPEVVRTGKPKTAVQITKEGRKVVLNGYPVFDRSGQVTLVVTFVRDVTVLSQLQEQIASQQKLIDFCNSKKLQSSPMILTSQKMLDLMNLLKKIAQTDTTVLILGETGVGKDILARRIHENSLRSSKPFLKVDCTAIPEKLIESELFGYEPGAFSGANTRGKPGFFEIADRGTLFLDEIGELPLPMQAKLLRVLQDQEVMRIGSTQVKKVDVRFIAATNRSLEEEVKEGTFRSDLFYRLRVAVLDIPPLRDRREDILPLARHFLEKYSSKYKKTVAFSPEVEKIFQDYKWPGNIREMENLIQSLIVTRDTGTIKATDLPETDR